jgi:integrase/recombinase XerD
MFQKSVNRNIKSNQLRHLTESFRLWLETLNYRPKTVKLATSSVEEFFAFLERQKVTRLKDFTNIHLDKYLDYLQHRPNCIKSGSLSAGYINKHISTLRLLSKYLQLTGKAGIAIKPGLLQTTETATYLSKEEINALYKAAESEKNLYNQRDIVLLSLFYGCGLRASEGEALNTGDILLKKDLVYVRKGKNYRERYVPINAQVKFDIKTYLVDQREELKGSRKTDALILNRTGQRWQVAGMYQRLQWLKNQTNIEELKQKSFGLHILRHSIATHLLQSGMKLEYISRFLGHKSLETTQKYTHLLRDNEF